MREVDGQQQQPPAHCGGVSPWRPGATIDAACKQSVSLLHFDTVTTSGEDHGHLETERVSSGCVSRVSLWDARPLCAG